MTNGKSSSSYLGRSSFKHWKKKVPTADALVNRIRYMATGQGYMMFFLDIHLPGSIIGPPGEAIPAGRAPIRRAHKWCSFLRKLTWSLSLSLVFFLYVSSSKRKIGWSSLGPRPIRTSMMMAWVSWLSRRHRSIGEGGGHRSRVMNWHHFPLTRWGFLGVADYPSRNPDRDSRLID